MSDRPSLIQQVSTITGCNDFQASLVLERCNWDMERAVNSFFDDPPPEKPIAASNTQNSSTAVVPFQGVTDRQAAAAAAWDVPSSQTYGPPLGPPPASTRGWETESKDVIDLSNDADADEDLRRAMAASLQDHQSQQTYRPPAPSSTVGVSEAVTAYQRQVSAQRAKQVEKRRRGSLRFEDMEYQPSSPPTPMHVEDVATGDAIVLDPKDADDVRIQENDSEVHGYRLRDRRKLVPPTHTGRILTEMGRQAKLQRTYKDRPTRDSRRPGQGRPARRGRIRRGYGWIMDVGMSEDEQLRQALEASVQSHHNLLRSNGSGARTPALPQHLETDLQSRRIPGAPIAMVAPFSSLEVVAALLQALFAAPQVRRAYLAARPPDSRGSDLSNYWKGASPTEILSDPTDRPTLEAHFELAQRIQTLFAFAQLSQRPFCVIKDVTSLAPSEVIARGADLSPPVKVASLFYEFVVESFTKHVTAVSDLILNTAGAEATQTDALWMDEGLFLSSGAAALTSPASSLVNGSQATNDTSSPVAAPAPKIEQQRSFLQLRHDSINSDIYSCLRAALASDGEGALLTRTARTISMGIEHALPTVDGGPPPLTINERIYLDSLMWDRRQGVRLDAELRDLEMVRLDTMRQELEARRRKLLGDGGRPSAEVLQGAKRYFAEVATAGDGTDLIRSSSLSEAAPQISKILEAVQADLAATDQLIAKVRAQIDAKRALVAERAKREAANPEWTQLAYDLCAVLCHEGGRCVTMVKQPNGTWWKMANGRAIQVDREDVVMGRPQDPSLSVFWVVYARVEDVSLSVEEVEAATEGLISENMKAAIADDNLTYESELLSLIRSDAATPSSTAEEDTIQLIGDQQAQKHTGDDVVDLTNTTDGSQDVTMLVDLAEDPPKSPRTS